MERRNRLFLWLVGANLIYACTSIFTKSASGQELFSVSFMLWMLGAVAVLGIYALLWQQIISRMDLSKAYMFKGLSLIFVLAISTLMFGESISVKNVLGSVLIVFGIGLYAKV